jgi:transcriptional regulator with XRE-family HTH domain
MAKTPYDLFLVQLRATRLSRDLTQAELAAQINLSRAQYTAIENGRSMINFQHLHNLAVSLNVRFAVGDSSAPFAPKVKA